MLMPNVSNRVGNVAASRTEAGSVNRKQSANAFDLMLSGLKDSSDATGAVKKDSAAVASHKTDAAEKARTQESADKQPRTDAGAEAGQVEAKKEAKLNPQKAVAANTDADKLDSEADIQSDDELDIKALLEKISALLAMVSELVMDRLELDAEEFNKLLEELNMTALDLLDTDKLQSFVLASSSEENVLALLTNERLSSVMKELNLQIDSLKAEAGLPQDIDTDRLKEMLADIGKMTEAPEDEGSVDLFDSTLFIDESLDGSEAAYNPEGKAAAGDIAQAATETEAESNIEAVKGREAAKDNAASDRNSTDLEQNSFRSFVDNMVNSVADQMGAVSENQAIAANLREISYQIIDRIRLEMKPDQTSLELSLSPESLGRVKLTIESREGAMTARFVVENQISKEAIESQLASLRESLNQQGIKVEAIEVTVSAYAFDQSQSSSSDQSRSESEKNNSGRHISLEEAMAMSEDIPEEAGMVNGNGLVDSQINYVA
ncbi:MAG: hypothetical protein GX757_13695 [Clostridiales bacterium]|nr:hypothetical protein [Clostridiales bacterium]